MLTILLGLATLAIKILAPSSVPQGVTFLALLVMFFGSASLFGLGLLGEYIGKILEETKARPPFIRKYLISSGKITAAQHHSEHPRGIGRG